MKDRRGRQRYGGSERGGEGEREDGMESERGNTKRGSHYLYLIGSDPDSIRLKIQTISNDIYFGISGHVTFSVKFLLTLICIHLHNT